MSIDKLMNEIRKGTKSTSFKESEFGKITDWISTGDPGLNLILSGDINKGIPSGKIMLIGGSSMSGKSLLVANIAANAINENNYDRVFYFDSEGGALRDFFEGRGVDLDKVEQILVDSVEDATVKILKVYSALEKYKESHPNSKFLCILDSLGALVADKLVNDAVSKGKQASDMGLTAKQKNSLMKAVLMPALKTNTSFLVVNHVYDDPASMFPSKIKNQSGGKGAQYAAHIILQCTKKFEKNENKKEEGNTYSATILRFFTTKNRIVKPFFETEMLLRYDKGSVKYWGLFEFALKSGHIVQNGAFYTIPSYGEKKFRKKEILKDEEVWASFLEDFNKTVGESMAYTSNSIKNVDECIDELLDDETE